MRIIQVGAKAGNSIIESSFNCFSKVIGAKMRLDLGVGKGNAGDTAIGAAFEYLFENEFQDSRVSFMNCRRVFTRKDIDYINKADALFICGGGLFLHDTFNNDASDWQWGIPKELLNEINIPVVVYAVGYNKFRGQREFSSRFDETVTRLAEKSIFFGLRNQGSCAAIKRHIDEKLHKCIKLIYCPTLLLNESLGFKNTLDNGSVGFVLAGDRLKHRHKDLNKFVKHIRKFVEYLKSGGITTVLLNHNNDTWIGKYVEFDRFIDLRGRDSKIIYRTYSKIDVVVGDRGHAQMIPFACGCKILTPVSHDKLKWFLEDLRLEEFGVEEHDDELSGKLLEKYNKLNSIDWRQMQREKMRMISQTNEKGLKLIKERLQEAFEAKSIGA